jgi:hypothetical protein
MRELTSLELQSVSGGLMQRPQPHPILVALLESVVKRLQEIIVRLGGGDLQQRAA